MKYKITLHDKNRHFSAVIFRDISEIEEARNTTMTIRKVQSIDKIYNKISEELKGQSAYEIQQIEELTNV